MLNRSKSRDRNSCVNKNVGRKGSLGNAGGFMHFGRCTRFIFQQIASEVAGETFCEPPYNILITQIVRLPIKHGHESFQYNQLRLDLRMNTFLFLPSQFPLQSLRSFLSISHHLVTLFRARRFAPDQGSTNTGPLLVPLHPTIRLPQNLQ